MKQPSTYTIFHIYRKDGTPLFLHPFGSPVFLGDILKNLNEKDVPVIKGLYGRDPRVESLTFFRNELYRLIEQSVISWMAEKRFIPRFLVSAGFFLLAYFFCAVVIRDPIPMIDEVLIGLGVSVLAYFLMGKNFKNSNTAAKKRIQMREMVDKIVFEPSPFIVSVEEILQENEALSSGNLMDKLVQNESTSSDGGDALSGKKTAEAEELLGYLEAQFDKEIVKWHEKSLASGRNGELKKNSRKVRGMKKVDLPLFSTYTRLKEFCRK